MRPYPIWSITLKYLQLFFMLHLGGGCLFEERTEDSRTKGT